MKKVKIFLASSIEELKQEKAYLGDFFGFLNEQYLDKGIHFSLIQCSSQTALINTAEEQLSAYDAQIKDSDISLFIFFKRVGDNTKHQFETALQHYENNGKPYILTTIKRIGGQDNPSEEVNSFMEMLDKELKHFYHFYSSPDQLKLWILMQIMVLKLDTTRLSSDGDSITLNGEKIADINNIPAFAGDNDLMQMKKRYQGICNEYNSLRQLMIKQMDDETWEKYSKIAAEKSDLEKEIRDKSISLLSLLQKITNDTAEGKLTGRLRENYRLIELGDYEGALEAVDLGEIQSDISIHCSIADRMIENLENNARELYARIETLEKKGRSKEIAEEIRQIYSMILDLFKKYKVGKSYLLAFSHFLIKHNDDQEAEKVLELLKTYCADPEAKDSEELSGRLYMHLGLIYSKTQRLKEAEAAYLKAMEILEQMAKVKPEEFNSDLADVLCNLGALYFKTSRMREAEITYLHAFDVHTRQADHYGPAFKGYMAHILTMLGRIYVETESEGEAELSYMVALSLFRDLAKADPLAYEEHVAHVLAYMGTLYLDTGQMLGAEYAYEEALDIWFRLTVDNPAAFEPQLAVCLSLMGSFYFKRKRFDEAETSYQKALEIRQRLASSNPSVFEPELANNLTLLGVLYHQMQRMDQAETAYLQALEIRQRMAEANLETCGIALGDVLDSLGILYTKTQRLEDAEKVYLQALEIRQKLAETNPVIHEPEMAITLNNLGDLYTGMSRLEEAKEVYSQAMEIWEKVAQTNPEKIYLN